MKYGKISVISLDHILVDVVDDFLDEVKYYNFIGRKNLQKPLLRKTPSPIRRYLSYSFHIGERVFFSYTCIRFFFLLLLPYEYIDGVTCWRILGRINVERHYILVVWRYEMKSLIIHWHYPPILLSLLHHANNIIIGAIYNIISETWYRLMYKVYTCSSDRTLIHIHNTSTSIENQLYIYIYLRRNCNEHLQVARWSQ